MKQEEQFTQIQNNAIVALWSDCNERERAVYMMLSKDCTYKYKLYGIYKHCTFSTLIKDLYAFASIDADTTQLKRVLKKLEKLELLKVLCDNKELIIALDIKTNLEAVKTALQTDVEAFNIFADRIKEIEQNLALKIAIKKKAVLRVVEVAQEEVPDFEGDLLKFANK